jgi:GDPmannose 4,6-dehydratase
MKTKKALITGITGQDGAYLTELLLKKGYEVHGFVRRSANSKFSKLEKLDIDLSRIKFIFGELTEQNQITDIIREGQYDEVYNLAAQSFVKYSFDNPLYTYKVDAEAVLYFLESIKRYSKQTRFYQASTSEMFGQVQAVPQNETTQFYPRSPYGIAKLTAHWLVKNYRESFGIFAVSGILFNHESPLRGEEFVTQKAISFVKSIGKPNFEKYQFGNIDAKRDWGYAKEYVNGMYLMLQQDKPDDFVLATNETHTVREMIEVACKVAGYNITWMGSGINEKGYVNGVEVLEISEEYYRPAEVELLIGDYSKAKKVLGWKPEVKFKELVSIMYSTFYDKS